MSHSRNLAVVRLIVVFGLITSLFVMLPLPVAQAATVKTGVNATYGICVRPGGISRPYTFGNDSTPDPLYPGSYPITQINYHNVPPFNWIISRGYYEYSTNGGSSWNPYTLDTWVAVAGTQWRFVDTQPGDTTSYNSFGVYWYLQGVPNLISSGGGITPDNPPTDISSDNYFILTGTGVGTTVATLTPTDTGCYQDGYWEIDSQSVPNLFTIAFDSATGNVATLSLGTGALPVAGQTATVTVRYYDLYQTDATGTPIPGQGFS
ncbi:MAG: hypothetical protein HY870_19800, partial [Chloroflexi bacterium]|nr:hypothetical protein [Chloroflexota bacterium]